MNYNSVITKLYFLLIHADGKVNAREIASGEQMVTSEAMNAEEFKVEMILLKSIDSSEIYSDALAGIKKLDREKQIRIVAWLCIVANADGFMDRTEWQFIYKLYHNELRLPLDEVMNKQKGLSRIQQPFGISAINQKLVSLVV